MFYVSLGPWAKKFLQPLGLDLPLRPVRVESLYWEIDTLPNNARSSVSLIDIEEDEGCYIIPEYEYPGLIKVIVLSIMAMVTTLASLCVAYNYSCQRRD